MENVQKYIPTETPTEAQLEGDKEKGGGMRLERGMPLLLLSTSANGIQFTHNHKKGTSKDGQDPQNRLMQSKASTKARLIRMHGKSNPT
mmetsp:Transcript_81005/g.217360  ORF Transcript_81005/g.217360 Transcript_81005/m.217360 type:complete len:89 (-) Transcript_81005:71-337(-)